MVEGGGTTDTDTPSKCQAKVLAQCTNKEHFTWRSTNNACHCVEEPNCNNPSGNSGLNIYRIDSNCRSDPGKFYNMLNENQNK